MILPHFNVQRPPTAFSRLGWLLAGSFYLVYLIGMGKMLAEVALWWIGILVLTGAVAIMAVLVACGIKADQHRGPVRRFRLSTVFLITIPLSIYLAVLRWLIQATWREPLKFEDAVVIGIIGVGWMMFTTAVLLRLADALMWLAVVLQRWVRRRRRRDAPP